jgi:hypothetical protein
LPDSARDGRMGGMRFALAAVLLLAASAPADDLFPLDPNKPVKTLPDLLAQLQTLKLSDQQRKEFLESFQKKSPEEQMKLLQQMAGVNPPAVPPTTVPPTPPTQQSPPEIVKLPPDTPMPPTLPDKTQTEVPTPGTTTTPTAPNELPPTTTDSAKPTESAADLKDKPGLNKFKDLWEKNVGPLEQTPELKKAILDLAKSGDLKLDGDSKAGEDLLKVFKDAGVEADDLKKWIDGLTPGDGWKMPDLSVNAPTTPTAPSLNIGGVEIPDVDPTVLAMLAAVAVAVFFVARYLPAFARRPAAAIDLAAATWPVGPNDVIDRPSLVTAFEFVSLQLCGDAARVWHHRTIATALRNHAARAEPVADRLADLYELARYTPPDVPLPPAALADARRCFGVLAGARA